MEDYTVQSKTIIAAILTALLAFGTAGAKQPDLTDINSSYGFDEIQIIKLDWGIKALKIADFNGDSLNDIAVANNKKSRIELLIQKPKPASSHVLQGLRRKELSPTEE
jgi:hypothetical protein